MSPQERQQRRPTRIVLVPSGSKKHNPPISDHKPASVSVAEASSKAVTSPTYTTSASCAASASSMSAQGYVGQTFDVAAATAATAVPCYFPATTHAVRSPPQTTVPIPVPTIPTSRPRFLDPRQQTTTTSVQAHSRTSPEAVPRPVVSPRVRPSMSFRPLPKETQPPQSPKPFTSGSPPPPPSLVAPPSVEPLTPPRKTGQKRPLQRGASRPTPTLITQGLSAGASSYTSPSMALDFAARQTRLTNSEQDAQRGARGVAPSDTAVLDFDSNPDVLALRSALSVLSVQKARAERDIVQLHRAKEEAVADPEAFLAHWMRRQKHVQVATASRSAGELVANAQDENGEHEEEQEEEDTEDMEHDVDMDGDVDMDVGMTNSRQIHHLQADPAIAGQVSGKCTKNTKKQKIKHKRDKNLPNPPQPAWTNIPHAQNIVRCPPINWAQYAVVGEGLDQLHKQQLRNPSWSGTTATVSGVSGPVAFGADDTYQFRGATGAVPPFTVGQGVPQGLKHRGIAAPYDPVEDAHGTAAKSANVVKEPLRKRPSRKRK